MALAAFFFLLAAAAAESSPSMTTVTFVLRPLDRPAPIDVDAGEEVKLLPWISEDSSSFPDLDLEDSSSSSPDLDLEQASLHIPLSHRDSLLPVGVSPEEILLLRLDRDAARSRALSSAAAPPNATNTRWKRGRSTWFSSPVVSGLAQGSGEYFTMIGVGTPARAALMVLDTGSDVVWLQCAPCRRCYHQKGPVFDPRSSASFSPVPCSSQICRRLDLSGCDLRRRSCLYQVSYGDGSATEGEFATETLTFRGGGAGRRVAVPAVAIGCGHENQGLFVAAAGLLGLGRGALSFPSQAGGRFGRRFSYCLADRTSSSAAAAGNRTSYIVFGDPAPPAAVYTPMVRNPRMDTFYYVDLEGVSVGGSRVAMEELRLDPATGKGGLIVDSGTSVTRLARPAYEAVRDAFRAGGAAGGLPRASPRGGFSLFDTCYGLGGGGGSRSRVVRVPTVALHFAGGATVELPPENYMIPVDARGTYCLAFAGTDSGVSIIGNVQQQGFRVVYDVAGSRVGFLPRGC